MLAITLCDRSRTEACRDFLVFFFCLTHIFSVNVQEVACNATYGINKTLILNKQTNKITARKILSPGQKHNAHAPQAVSNQPHRETKVIANNSQQVRKGILAGKE